MRIEFGLCLPRDETSVPLVRHLCRATLKRLGAEAECVHDIEVAVSEACTNVLRHVSSSDDQYEVGIVIEDVLCTVRVTDAGEGFDSAVVVGSDLAAESGRGIQLMRHLVDDLNFSSRPEEGTVVELRKGLSLEASSIIRLMGSRAPAAGFDAPG
ncbi:MAG: ATP-binding protein [Actinomycetota bacterium]